MSQESQNLGPFPAVYNDGQSARAYAADVGVLDDGLMIRAVGASPMLWRFETIARLDGPAGSGLRLASSEHVGARITITDEAAEALLAAAPALARVGASRSERARTVKWLAGALAGLALLAWGALEGLPRAFAMAPMSWAATIGENVSGQALGVFGGEPCNAAAANAALATLTERLLADVEPSLAFDPAEVKVSLISSYVPNAFAAPGGRVVMFTGLFDLLESDDIRGGGDAIAGVLAHELAHARYRHPTRALGRALGLEMLLLAIGGGFSADAGALLAQLAYGRDAELEADELAREMLTAIGVGDAGLKDFFAKVQAKFGDDEPPAILSTHPPTLERLNAGPGVRGPNAAFSDAEWAALLAAADGGC